MRTDRFACALRRNGFGPGTGVASLTGRIPDLYVSALGALKAQCVFTPMFSAFGPEPIAQRLHLGRIRILVTTPMLYRRKVAGIVDRLPDLELVLVCGATEDQTAGSTTGMGGPRVLSMGSFLCDATDTFDIGYTDPETPALLHFTSGTTGTPKGAVHVHGAVVTHHLTGRLVLDLHPDDVFWCTADPGLGDRHVLRDHRAADQRRDEHHRRGRLRRRTLVPHPRAARVDVFYTAPTAIRMLQRLGPNWQRRTTSARCGSSPASVSRSMPRPCDGARRASVSRSSTPGGRRRRAAS